MRAAERRDGFLLRDNLGFHWRVIYPGSWLIRWSWLRAIEARLVP